MNSGSAGSDAVITSTTTLNDVTLEGQWTHNPGVTVTLRGVIDGPGTLCEHRECRSDHDCERR